MIVAWLDWRELDIGGSSWTDLPLIFDCAEYRKLRLARPCNVGQCLVWSCVSLADFVQVHDLELSSHGSQLM